jgi:hypothetical protein
MRREAGTAIRLAVIGPAHATTTRPVPLRGFILATAGGHD